MRREEWAGLSLGMVCAAILSWTTWHSIGWAIFHGMCGWAYIFYWGLIQP